MTDPVNTDALRDMGATLTKDGHLFGPRITAAADEVDRLRAELQGRDERTGMEIRFRHTLEQKYDRLRAVIENAPHAQWCRGEWVQEYASGEYRGCTCWKADAL